MNTLCRLTSVLSLAVLLAACAAQPRPEPTPDADAGKRPTTATKAAAPTPAAPPTRLDPAVEAALLPPVVQTLREHEQVPERRFDVDVHRAPAREFFMSLVKGTPYNMIVHPDVKGRVSLSLSGVTVPEVMDLVREVYGYEYELRGRNYIVTPRRLQARVFPINYLNLKRMGESRVRISSGSIQRSNGQYGTTGSTGSVTGTGIYGGTGGRALPAAKVKTETEVDYWTELVKALKAIVGEGKGREVIATPQASVVLVRGMPAELREVERFLRQSQLALERQVIIEAKIVEVQLRDSFQAGINWANLASVNGNPVLIGQTGGGTLFSQQEGLGSLFQNDMTTGIKGNVGDLNPGGGTLPVGTAVSAFGGVFTVAASASNFAAFLELLQTQGNVNVLSSPRISTVNNQKAVIKVGHDELFVTGVSSTTTTTAASATSFPNVELTPFFSGIALDVTPQISEDGMVTLHIHPSITDVKDDRKEILIADQQISLPLAISTIRESDSIVQVKSGQMVVIGGLMSEVEQDLDGGVPWLSDIPVIGNAFKHKSTHKVKTELVILLKPVVVEAGQPWQQQIDGLSEAMRKRLGE